MNYLHSVATKILTCPSASSTPLYFVGGVVRDFLMLGDQYAPVDIDILVDGDFEKLLSECSAVFQGTVKKHDRFLTAKIESDSLSIDFVRARKEEYERPGALPTVKPGSLVTDIKRRDFTLNALAIPLAKVAEKKSILPSDILDLCGGLADLNNRTLRVFHERSFIDDPTRILRAARYAGRYRFVLETQTDALLRNATKTKALKTVSSSRIYHELERVAAEKSLSAVGSCLKSWEVLSCLPLIMWNELSAIKMQCSDSINFTDIFFASIIFASEEGHQFLKDAGISKKNIKHWQKLIEDAFKPQEFESASNESLFLASAINPTTPWREELERRDIN